MIEQDEAVRTCDAHGAVHARAEPHATGADVLCDVLLANDVDVCFANPGTSEMHFVAALDRKPQMRCVLGLFEGVVTGAADGYARMADKPAATLLHLGPGLANGLANLHNARRASTPMINVVGDHASHHLAHDAPLTSDIENLAAPMSHWVRRIASASDVAAATGEAWRQAMSRPGIATLILPADAAWTHVADTRIERTVLPPPCQVDDDAIQRAADILRSPRRTALLLSGRALREHALRIAGRIAAATGATLYSQFANGRMERGAGRVPVPRVPYGVDDALAALAGFDALISIDAKPPVAFFAYPGKPGSLLREDCLIFRLAQSGDDVQNTLERLAERVGTDKHCEPAPAAAPGTRPSLPTGPLTEDAIAIAIAQLLPEHAIVCDEALTSARRFFTLSHGSPPHDYLQITGGSIGIGIPLCTGASIACPGRKVIGLQADGSGMYTIQGLWTQAREQLDVITVVFSNRAYAILRNEMANVGIRQFGLNAQKMMELQNPVLDWVAMAKGMGVDAGRADTVEAFVRLFKAALAQRGPFLIEAVL